MPLEQALAEPIRLAELGTAGPLVDLVKLDDICADYVAALSGGQILDQVTTWAREHDPPLAAVLETESDLALRALAIEREGVANPRKDLQKWADFRTVYGYFFPRAFPAGHRPGRSPVRRPGSAPGPRGGCCVR
jgi:glutamyl-tRNA synthetase